MFEHAEPDVLILLECCAAASSISGDGSRVTEIIAVCGFETWAPAVGEHSFTRSLIDELKYWSSSQILTAAMLHNKVLSRIKYWKPRFDANGGYERRKTPIYVVLSNEGKQRSIELTPLQTTNTRKGLAELSADSVSSTSSDRTPEPSCNDTNGVHNGTSQTSFDLSSSQRPPYPQVLVSLALEEDQWLQTDDWFDWLTTVPALVKHVRVHGVFESDSTLLLISLSVAVWDLLPKHPAVSFIGFVKSNNMLLGRHFYRDQQDIATVPLQKDDRGYYATATKWRLDWQRSIKFIIVSCSTTLLPGTYKCMLGSSNNGHNSCPVAPK